MKFWMKEKCAERKMERMRRRIEEADAVILGAGAGLSTAAGFVYDGERFRKWFSDFEEKYDFHDMYTGGFYPYETLEEHWAYWSRYIYVNRYLDAPKPLYEKLLELVQDKDYFVLTTNVDHCFQKAGFDKKRLFYTQGDYGLFQCSKPCCQKTYDNESAISAMMESQGFVRDENGKFVFPESGSVTMKVPTELIQRCPECGAPMTMNLRADDSFVQDAGWDAAAERYSLFLKRHEHMNVVYLELGVGYNTPGIIKYPFWQMTAQNPNAAYICLNNGQAYCPAEIENQAICVDGDIWEIMKQ